MIYLRQRHIYVVFTMWTYCVSMLGSLQRGTPSLIRSHECVLALYVIQRASMGRVWAVYNFPSLPTHIIFPTASIDILGEFPATATTALHLGARLRRRSARCHYIYCTARRLELAGATRIRGAIRLAVLPCHAECAAGCYVYGG